MTDLRSAAQQALEALETDAVSLNAVNNAASFLRAALEQPERPNLLGWSFHRNSDGSIGIKSPPPRPGESKRTSDCVYPCNGADLHELLSKFVDHIAALEQEQEQEPVAWRWRMRNPTDSPGFAQPWNVTTYYPREQANEIEPLYTAPPRREWRGLKEWEINDGLDQLPTEDVCNWSFRKGVYFAEKALKERNT